jgi:Kef-type K+ transport system membrane component KefB
MGKHFEHLSHSFHLPLTNPVLVFSLVLFIILLSPILLRKLNIPGIIGLIISGVIIGPHGLNLLEKNSAVELFSTIGLLYIMFIAGLDLDLNQFRMHRHRSFWFGFFTFTLPLAIGFPVCYYILDFSFNASLLTASMFSTHTLVAYPIVSKLGVSKNPAVAITVGGTILTDTAVLLLFAVILGNNAGTLDEQFWIKLGISISIFLGIMFFIIPRIASWFFQKLESEKHAHYIFVLSVVFFAAFMAEVAGLEPIIGAFVAGLALNRLIPHTSALMNRIEFIGNSLFIPFFLISVGMVVDITVLLKGPTALIVAFTLTVVALIGKWVAAFFTQFMFKYTAVQRQLIFGLSASHAAATLAIILIGYRVGILDENVLNGTIILILITCMVASFATERAARKIAIRETPDESALISDPAMTDEHILVPIANVANLDKLIEFSLFVKDKKSIHPVSLLTVVQNDEAAEQNILTSKNKLEEFVAQGSAAEVPVQVIATIDHHIASGIARTAREIMADIIIIGWPRKTGLLDKLMGERRDNIIQNVTKTLFICHIQQPVISFKRIVIVTPRHAELEVGFSVWVRKLAKLSNELTLPVTHYGHQSTHQAMLELTKKLGLSIPLEFQVMKNIEQLTSMENEIIGSDFLLVVSSREGALSYHSNLEDLPKWMERWYHHHSKVLIFPQQNSMANSQISIKNLTPTHWSLAPKQMKQAFRKVFNK